MFWDINKNISLPLLEMSMNLHIFFKRISKEIIHDNFS